MRRRGSSPTAERSARTEPFPRRSPCDGGTELWSRRREGRRDAELVRVDRTPQAVGRRRALGGTDSADDGIERSRDGFIGGGIDRCQESGEGGNQCHDAQREAVRGALALSVERDTAPYCESERFAAGGNPASFSMIGQEGSRCHGHPDTLSGQFAAGPTVNAAQAVGLAVPAPAW